MGKYDHIDDLDYLRHLLATAEAHRAAYVDRDVHDELVEMLQDDNDEEIIALQRRIDQLNDHA